MKTLLIVAACLSPLSLPAAEADLNIATCFSYMMQSHRFDGAKTVARKVTDLDAVQHYFIAALRAKVSDADGKYSCALIGVDPHRYKIVSPQP
jgi:hypothetical protein